MEDDFKEFIRKKLQSVKDGIQLHSHNGKLLPDIPREVELFGSFTAGVFVALMFIAARHKFKRFSTVDDIPAVFFQEKRKIKGKIVSVSDGDTFRVRHLPLLRGVGSYDGKLSENTLQIRLAAIDTPETPKFGEPGQPFGEEAKKWLTKTLSGRTLSITLLHRDQYSRAVGMVNYGMWPFRKNASEEILKVGLANIYRQGGAVYGGNLQKFEAIEAAAKKKKLGIWSLGKKLETAGEYKARTRAA